MGNGQQQKTAIRTKQIERYSACSSDAEQAQKHLLTANQFFFYEDFDKARDFYLQTLSYNPDCADALTHLAEIYKRQQRKCDAFLCILRREYILSGNQSQLPKNFLYSQQSAGANILQTYVPTEESLVGQEILVNEPLTLAKKYYLASKALVEILPLFQVDFEKSIQQLRKEGWEFELIFFIEQAFEKHKLINERNESELLNFYQQNGLKQKLLNFITELQKIRPKDETISKRIADITTTKIQPTQQAVERLPGNY